MKLSKKGEYALRALIDLGIATEAGRDVVQLAELAENQQIPAKFLEAILQELKSADILTSQRGKFGGYRLAREAAQIVIGDVIRLIDGPLAPIGCVSQTCYEKCSCPDEVHCGLRMLMLDVRNAIAGILDRYSLANVVDVTTRKMKRDGLPLPFSNELQPGTARTVKRKKSTGRNRVAPARRVQPVEGILSELFPDYTI